MTCTQVLALLWESWSNQETQLEHHTPQSIQCMLPKTIDSLCCIVVLDSTSVGLASTNWTRLAWKAQLSIACLIAHNDGYWAVECHTILELSQHIGHDSCTDWKPVCDVLLVGNTKFFVYCNSCHFRVITTYWSWFFYWLEACMWCPKLRYIPTRTISELSQHIGQIVDFHQELPLTPSFGVEA